MESPHNLSYYSILQVSSIASQEVIRGAYRALLKDSGIHPDLGGNAIDAQLINEAYQVLSNPKTRKEYDRLLSSRVKQENPQNTIVLLVCPNCRTPNKLTNQHQDNRCHKCKQSLLPTDKPNESAPNRAYRLGIFLFEKGLFIRAQHEFETAIKYQPKKPHLHYWLGRCLYQRRLFPKARQSFQNAIIRDANQFHYHFWDGQSLYAIKSHHEAVQAFQKALALRPKHWPTMMRLASAQVRIGTTDEALITLNQAIEIEPTRNEFYTLRGMVYLSLENKKEARESFQKAHKINPDDSLAKKYLVMLSK